MSKVIITVGIPASGKTTYIKNEQKENINLKRLSRDDLRLMLDDYQISDRNEKLINEIQEELLLKLLAKKYDVAIDATHLKSEYVTRIQKIVEEHNKLYNDSVEIIIKYFPIELKEALKRNEKRIGQSKVPEKIIKEMYERYKRLVPIVLKPIEDKTVQQDENLPEVVIVDIDGTLAHNVSRNIYDYERVGEDEVDFTIKEMLIELCYPTFSKKIICVSGRDDSCFEKTQNWLKNNGIIVEKLFMRKTGDRRQDYVIKEEIFRKYILPNYYTFCVFDDRSSVVKMFRRLGLKVFQVAPGDF